MLAISNEEMNSTVFTALPEAACGPKHRCGFDLRHRPQADVQPTQASFVVAHSTSPTNGNLKDMGKRKRRYVGRAIAATGWRIWDNKLQRFWGEVYDPFPHSLLDELNGEKRPQSLASLAKKSRLTPRRRR